MKKILIALLLLCLKLNVYGQTLATDFTVTDCAGTSHHLFSELDSGKIVVLDFVMPCVGCVSPTSTTYNIVKSFGLSHPSKVRLYMVDDDGDNNCTVLSGWESANFFWTVPKLTNPAVVQGQYGAPGMPKIVVLGNTGHYVYAIQNNWVDSMQLTNAINDAINGVIPATIPNAVAQPGNAPHLLLCPNPTKDQLNLSCDLASGGDVTLTVFDAAGTRVKTIIKKDQSRGHHTFTVDTDDLSGGNYFLKLQSGDQQQSLKFTITK